MGYTEAEFAKAFELFGQFDIERGVADLEAALGGLRTHPECDGLVGVMDFCLGGKLAYLTAARDDPAITVCFYGVEIVLANVNGDICAFWRQVHLLIPFCELPARTW